MNYSVRNPFYLRISKNTVLPIYVYLDERHVHWMSDTILQHVLSDLRPNILPKLKAEVDVLSSATTQKKATVDTHRGDSYQFCYFFRKTEPHAILIKSRNFTVAPLQKAFPNLRPSQSKAKQKKRKEVHRESPIAPTRSKRRRIIQQQSLNGDDADPADTITNAPADEDDDSDEYTPHVEMEIVESETVDAIELEIETQEEKPKPILEPWPIVRSMTVGPSVRPHLTTQTTLQISPSTSSKVPLFLPEENEVEERPRLGEENRSRMNEAYLKKVMDQDELASDDDDNLGGMMEFSQVLHNIGDSRAGAINDDDDMDGAILFGDADEIREL